MVKLSYIVLDENSRLITCDIKTFATKKAAQVFDRHLNESVTTGYVTTKLIYDDETSTTASY